MLFVLPQTHIVKSGRAYRVAAKWLGYVREEENEDRHVHASLGRLPLCRHKDEDNMRRLPIKIITPSTIQSVKISSRYNS